MSGGSSIAEPAASRVIGNDELAGLAAEVLSRGGSFRFQATGTSMHPLIRSGDSVVICSPAEPLLPGSVVLTRRQDSGIVMVHRLIRCSDSLHGRGFVTMGDNSRTLDLPVGREEIIGVVSAVVRDGKVLDTSGRLQKMGGRSLAWLGARRSGLLEAQGCGRWWRRAMTVMRLLLSRILWLAQEARRGRPG